MRTDALTLRTAMAALGTGGSHLAAHPRSPVESLAAMLDLHRSVSLADVVARASSHEGARAPAFGAAACAELGAAASRLDAIERDAMGAVGRALARRPARPPAAIRSEIARHLESAREDMRGVREDVTVVLCAASPAWRAVHDLDTAMVEATAAKRAMAWSAALDSIEGELGRASPRLVVKVERVARAMVRHERTSVDALARVAIQSLSVDTKA